MLVELLENSRSIATGTGVLSDAVISKPYRYYGNLPDVSRG